MEYHRIKNIYKGLTRDKVAFKICKDKDTLRTKVKKKRALNRSAAKRGRRRNDAETRDEDQKDGGGDKYSAMIKSWPQFTCQIPVRDNGLRRYSNL